MIEINQLRFSSAQPASLNLIVSCHVGGKVFSVGQRARDLNESRGAGNSGSV
jgi:hypothetical protein